MHNSMSRFLAAHRMHLVGFYSINTISRQCVRNSWSFMNNVCQTWGSLPLPELTDNATANTGHVWYFNYITTHTLLESKLCAIRQTCHQGIDQNDVPAQKATCKQHAKHICNCCHEQSLLASADTDSLPQHVCPLLELLQLPCKPAFLFFISCSSHVQTVH